MATLLSEIRFLSRDAPSGSEYLLETIIVYLKPGWRNRKASHACAMSAAIAKIEIMNDDNSTGPLF
jgi:hypothetical protein